MSNNTCPPGKLCFSSDKTILILLAACVLFALYHFRNEEKLKEIKNKNKSSNIINQKKNNNYMINMTKNINKNMVDLNQRIAKLENKQAVQAVTKKNKSSSSTPDPPIRDNPYGINFPTNIKTRGEELGYHLVGVITNEDKSKVLQLYGKEVYRNSNKWNYYTMTDQYNPVTVSIKKGDDSCIDEYGCQEIRNGDNVTVPIYGTDVFTATINKMNYPRYIP